MKKRPILTQIGCTGQAAIIHVVQNSILVHHTMMLSTCFVITETQLCMLDILGQEWRGRKLGFVSLPWQQTSGGSKGEEFLIKWPKWNIQYSCVFRPHAASVCEKHAYLHSMMCFVHNKAEKNISQWANMILLAKMSILVKSGFDYMVVHQ